MTLAPELETWSLTPKARAELEDRGITLSELYRLLQKPAMTLPGLYDGEKRVNGYGLSALIHGREIRSVAIDGQTADNWSDWATERAEFGDGDVAGADQLLRETFTSMTERLSQKIQPRRQRKEILLPPARSRAGKTVAGKSPIAAPAPKPIAAPPAVPAPHPVLVEELELAVGEEIMERIHPKLRGAILAQCNGDFSRLVVETATKVTVLPPRPRQHCDELDE